MQIRKVELSDKAVEKLQQITDYYLFHETSARTLKVLASFDEAFKKIAAKPFNYKKFISAEFINLDIRIYTHFKTYHIYYIVFADKISIAEIFHLKQSDDKLMIGV
jgi:plasmid stabilization system protein ParE